MRHVTRIHAVEAFRRPKGIIVTVKQGDQPLVRADGGDWLAVHQDGPDGATRLELLKDKAFGEKYYASTDSPAEGGTPAKQKRRGGRKAGVAKGLKQPRPRAATLAKEIRSRAGSSIRALPSEEKREKCRKLYEGGMELPAIASAQGVKYATLYGWKTNGGWERN